MLRPPMSNSPDPWVHDHPLEASSKCGNTSFQRTIVRRSREEVDDPTGACRLHLQDFFCARGSLTFLPGAYLSRLKHDGPRSLYGIGAQDRISIYPLLVFMVITFLAQGALGFEA